MSLSRFFVPAAKQTYEMYGYGGFISMDDYISLTDVAHTDLYKPHVIALLL